jgi:uncharacterized protein (TIGR04255 family)
MPIQGNHPVFPNPSVKHVVLEVQFPSTMIDPAEADDGMRAGLRDQFPLSDQTTQQTLAVDFGGGTQIQSVVLLRYQSRDRTRTVAVSPETVTIETTEYLGFDWYLDFLRKPLGVLADVLRPDGIVGMGHRFIDEVQVPNKGAPIDWAQWIDARLLAPSLVPIDAGLDAPIDWHGSMNYQTSTETTLTLRYGPMQSSATNSAGAGGRSAPAPADTSFMLDWDSRWTPAVVPEFTAEAVLEHCTELYGPVRTMFHHLISDNLREVFFAPFPEGD